METTCEVSIYTKQVKYINQKLMKDVKQKPGRVYMDL